MGFAEWIRRKGDPANRGDPEKKGKKPAVWLIHHDRLDFRAEYEAWEEEAA